MEKCQISKSFGALSPFWRPCP